MIKSKNAPSPRNKRGRLTGTNQNRGFEEVQVNWRLECSITERSTIYTPLLVEMLSNSTGISTSFPPAISSCRDTICNESTAE